MLELSVSSSTLLEDRLISVLALVCLRGPNWIGRRCRFHTQEQWDVKVRTPFSTLRFWRVELVFSLKMKVSDEGGGCLSDRWLPIFFWSPPPLHVQKNSGRPLGMHKKFWSLPLPVQMDHPHPCNHKRFLNISRDWPLGLKIFHKQINVYTVQHPNVNIT